MKTEFICVKPRTSEAQDRFTTRMNNLHSCRVDKREYGKVIFHLFLESIYFLYTKVVMITGKSSCKYMCVGIYFCKPELAFVLIF